MNEPADAKPNCPHCKGTGTVRVNPSEVSCEAQFGPCPDCFPSPAESVPPTFGKLTKVDTGLKLAQFLNYGYGRRQAKPSIISTADPTVFDDLEFAQENEDNIVFYTRQNPKPE